MEIEHGMEMLNKVATEMKEAQFETLQRCRSVMLTSSSVATRISKGLFRVSVGAQVKRRACCSVPSSQLPRLFMLRQCSSLTGTDVMEHALKCLLRLLFFVWRTETRRAFAEDVLKANQPILCHLSPP